MNFEKAQQDHRSLDVRYSDILESMGQRMDEMRAEGVKPSTWKQDATYEILTAQLQDVESRMGGLEEEYPSLKNRKYTHE